MSITELKNKAKNDLKGKYRESIKLLLMLFGIQLIIGLVLEIINLGTFLVSIVSLMLTSAFEFGTISFFLKISRGEEVDYKELFKKTNLTFRYIALSTVLVVIYLIGYIISLISSQIFFLFGSITMIITCIIITSYSFILYIGLEEPNLNIKDVFCKSRQMLNGHKIDLFLLGLSFIGWIILGAFTFGLLYLWLFPYMAVSFSNFYNYLKTI